MSEAHKRRKKAVAAGIVGLASLMGVAATGLVIGLAAAGGPDPTEQTAAEPVAIDWPALADAAMSARGYGFASAGLKDGVLTFTGDAPDLAARERAFEIGRDAVIENESHVGTVLAFNNAITVAGTEVPGAPDAASALGANPAAEACQTAYTTLLTDRVINFESGSAVIAPASYPLLDSLAAVAQRCVGYRVEIGGHTDALGDDGANQALSERRAQSVADYLVGKGVAATQLGVRGYGETEPLDASGTPEADAKNRRIGFKVEAKP